MSTVGPPDLLFLVTLTSSVCVVSEAIKMAERWREAEKTPPTDFFHEVWRPLLLAPPPAVPAAGGQRRSQDHIDDGADSDCKDLWDISCELRGRAEELWSGRQEASWPSRLRSNWDDRSALWLVQDPQQPHPFLPWPRPSLLLVL